MEEDYFGANRFKSGLEIVLHPRYMRSWTYREISKNSSLDEGKEMGAKQKKKEIK